MSKRNPGNLFQKAPTKKEIEAVQKKYEEERAELVKKMNIPPRDEEKYPMPEKDEIAKAASFVYTLGALAESFDENLKSLVWTFYCNLMECMKNTSGQKELFEMIGTLTYLKEYIAKSNNPLFSDKPNANG